MNVHEAKTHFSKLLDRAHAGEEIILAKSGKPYARLVPLEAPKKRELGFVKASIPENLFLEPMSDEELADWEDGPVFPPGADGEGSE